MLSPQELVKIGRHLTSDNNLEKWCLWTKMLFACKLFLRSDEHAEFTDSDFVPQLTAYDAANQVTMLAVRVQGKSDDEEVILCIWRDDDVPELCLVRALLAWVALSGYTGGYLFPNLKNRRLPLDPKSFLSQCKRACRQVTGRDGPFGTHVCRKTGWCLATWGGASDVDMAQASRHRSQQMASRYKKDASTLLEIAKNQP
jgi:hypothetical protein